MEYLPETFMVMIQLCMLLVVIRMATVLLTGLPLFPRVFLIKMIFLMCLCMQEEQVQILRTHYGCLVAYQLRTQQVTVILILNYIKQIFTTIDLHLLFGTTDRMQDILPGPLIQTEVCSDPVILFSLQSTAVHR